MGRINELNKVYQNDRAMAKLAMTKGVSHSTRVYALKQFIVRSANRCKELESLGESTGREHMFQRGLKRALDATVAIQQTGNSFAQRMKERVWG